MNPDPRLVADIKSGEGCKLTAYRDSKGFWTIGWGHLLDQSKDWTGYTITQDGADQLLLGDIASAQAYAAKLPEWQALDTPCRQNAVSELCFNMRGKWLGFHDTRAALMRKDWADAKIELLGSAWANEVQPHGLAKPGRATRIAGYILTGQYPV